MERWLYSWMIYVMIVGTLVACALLTVSWYREFRQGCKTGQKLKNWFGYFAPHLWLLFACIVLAFGYADYPLFYHLWVLSWLIAWAIHFKFSDLL